MDDPGLDPREHALALAGLARINRLSGAARTLWREVAVEARTGAPLTLLDVATGSADVPIALAGMAARAGVALRLLACDASEVALDAARRRAASAGVSIELFRRDVLSEGLGLEDQSVDVAACSLFLHHLEESRIISVLREMARVSRGRVLAMDLRRSGWHELAARVVPRLLTRSRVVHVDAVRSVQGALTPGEVLELSRRAGLEGAQVSRAWPWRMVLRWRRARV